MSYHLKILPSNKRLLLSKYTWCQYQRFYADLEPKTVRKLFAPNPTKVRYKPIKPPIKAPSFLNEMVTRKNKVGIQMLSKAIYEQVFTDGYKETANAAVLELCKKELAKHSMSSDQLDLQKDVDFKIPPIQGKNIEEHFQIIGEQQVKPYKDLVHELLNGIPKPPTEWALEEGWVRYEPGKEPCRVDFPLEEALVFDVEVCMMVGKAPTLATAVSSKAWYGWVSRTLISGTFKPNTSHHYHPQELIPLESNKGDDGLNLTHKQSRPKVVIGHNVSFDRARIKEQYWLKKTGTRFIDTMSLHVCVSGLTSYQRAVMKSEKFIEEDEFWKSCSSLNNLVDVYQLYCGKKHSKQTRDIFMEGTLSDIKSDFQQVMNYCCTDVTATYEIMEKLYPLFQQRFPHPVTLAGMLELGTAYLPINQNWNRYISDCEQSFEDLESEGRILLARRADQACQLMHDEAYKKDLWLWDQDWEVKNLKTKAPVKRKKKVIVSEEELAKIEITSEEEASRLSNKNKSEDIEEIDPLEKKFESLWCSKENLSSVKVLLPGYPNWYRKLCTKPGSTQDWTPGPHLLGTAMKITPKLMCLTWEGYPLHHIKEKGWGFLVPFCDDLDIERKLPLEQLLEKCPLPIVKGTEAKGNDALSDITKTVDTELMRKEFYSRVKKDKTDGLYKGTGVWCNTTVEDCCWFFKLPHKDGSSYNVGNPLAKDFINKFSENVLAGDAESAEKVLKIARMLSYWRNNRARILDQMVVWLPETDLPEYLRDKRYVYGAIIPQVVVCGTLTRRAMEPTWMTASNAHPERIGSELRAMVQAPPGYKIVGADVDSQELWIASVLGDSYKAGLHGATPFGWMTLSGQKANGTDMHSVTAKAVGISRDHAKVINYARIYGAGQSFAERLLKQFNPSMSESEARSKAQKMFALTKGKKIFFIKPEHALDFDPDKAYNMWQAFEIAKSCGKTVEQMFYKSKWIGGTESAMFNRLEEVANSKEPRTPFLNGRLTRALEPKNTIDDRYLPTRVNWVVQSGAVDFLHLMLVCMKWIMGDKIRFCISFHDEIRYLVPEQYQYKAALALHVTNLLTRSFCAYKLGLRDLPQSVAFFSSVEVDTVLRKECENDCQTPSNPHGLEKGYGIGKGENLDIYRAIEKASGKYSCWFDDSRAEKFLEEENQEMSRATKRKHVLLEVLQDDFSLPTANQQIVKVVNSRGNNLHEVQSTNGSTFLVSMPTKFRKNVWVKRNDFILVEPIEEGDKVKGEIVRVLSKDHVKYFKKENVWPEEFDNQTVDNGDGDDIFENTNRPAVSDQDSEESSDDSDNLSEREENQKELKS